MYIFFLTETKDLYTDRLIDPSQCSILYAKVKRPRFYIYIFMNVMCVFIICVILFKGAIVGARARG